MYLFERVKFIAQDKQGFGSILNMAKAIGCTEGTFRNYLNPGREHNLWGLLPKILDACPRANKYWLYFEEGEPFPKVHNRTGKSVGDAIGELLDLEWSIVKDDGSEPERLELAGQLRKHLPQFSEVLKNQRFPTYEEIDLLYHLVNLDSNLLFCASPKNLPYKGLRDVEPGIEGCRKVFDEELYQSLVSGELRISGHCNASAALPGQEREDVALKQKLKELEQALAAAKDKIISLHEEKEDLYKEIVSLHKEKDVLEEELRAEQKERISTLEEKGEGVPARPAVSSGAAAHLLQGRSEHQKTHMTVKNEKA